MSLRTILFFMFFNFVVTKAAILIWSTKKVQISPLLPFDDEDLKQLVNKLNISKVFIFHLNLSNKNSHIPANLQEIISPYYSAFNPNGNVGTSNATELLLREDCNGVDTNNIRKLVGGLPNSTDFMCVLNILYSRKKRDLENVMSTEEPLKNNIGSKGPVIYIGESKNKDQFALLYSSRPLKLEVNNDTKYLGNTDNNLITVDKRFNIPIPLEDNGKVILRFVITWTSGYWYIQSAKVELIDKSNEISTDDLSTNENIMAPAHFSYHCNGQSVFANPSTGAKLTIYDLQVQVDARKKKFDDANDCVTFTTAPIWSGLFVTAILGLGIIVAITAIMDIKTMDKFDNQATKNLGITVME